MKNRDNIQIYMAILKSIKNGKISSTQILYGSEINYNQLRERLSRLVETGYVINDEKEYKITQKGMEILEEYEPFEELFKELDDEK